MQIGEISRRGGWRGHPNSLAALRTIPYPLQRHCKRCRAIAVRGQDHCRMHLGRWSPLSSGAGRGESRQLAKLERLGLLPLELLALPFWRGLVGLPTNKRAPMRLALVQGWDKRLTAPIAWAAVQRRAIDLAQTPGRRQATAHWYANR